MRVIDPHGVGAGSSGGVVGALAPHTPENWNAKKAFQFDSLMMAKGFWAAVEAVSGISSGYGRLGRLQPIPDARVEALAEAREKSAKHLWQGKATWRVVDSDDHRGWAPASATGRLVFDTLSARIHPAQACESLAGALRARGAEIVEEGPDDGPVVWATGIHGLEMLSDEIGRSVGSGVKGQAALLAHDAGAVPQIFGDALHIIPHHDGTVAVGSTSERDFTAGDTTDALLDDVIARAALVVPALHGARVLKRWAGVRPRARTRAPILGRWPGREGHFIANGGFKIGFGMAPKVAAAMADLMLDGVDDIPDEFRVDAAL